MQSTQRNSHHATMRPEAVEENCRRAIRAFLDIPPEQTRSDAERKLAARQNVARCVKPGRYIGPGGVVVQNFGPVEMMGEENPDLRFQARIRYISGENVKKLGYIALFGPDGFIRNYELFDAGGSSL